MKNREKILQLFKLSDGVSTDSREELSGRIFFALKGERFNGNKYAKAALEEGALAVVVSELIDLDEVANVILVEDTLVALQNLATDYINEFDIPILAITGSNGKTTTKELIRDVLKEKYEVHSTKGNFNNHIGVPLTILDMPETAEMAIIEMGANHLKEIAQLCEIAHPNFGLITNIGSAHVEGFGSLENIFIGKTELYDWLRKYNGKIFYNAQDDQLQKVLYDYSNVIPYNTFGGRIELGSYSSDPRLKIQLSIDEEEYLIETHLSGDYNLINILAAIEIGLYFNVDVKNCLEAIESYHPDNNRSQIMNHNGNHYLMDAYNANPSSMRASISNFAKFSSSNKILIIGDMLELGQLEDSAHSEILDLAMRFDWEHIITVGKLFPVRESVTQFDDVKSLKLWFDAQNFTDKWILLKASRGIRLEKLLD